MSKKHLKWVVSEFEPSDTDRIGGTKADHTAWLRREDGRFLSLSIPADVNCISEEEAKAMVEKIAAALSPTPAAQWREEGKPDPHDTRYDCERHETLGGHYTDDQVANAVFLQTDIQTTTIAKDRIRWLSRRLTKCEEALKPFADYGDQKRSVPAGLVVSTGSLMARKQLTMGDCYKAAEALGSKP